MVCTAPWKAWQTTERGLRQSRTPHARSSCIIGHFLTIAWGTQILAIVDSQVRSYDRRTVSVEWSVRRANCKRFTHKRPTDGSGSRPVQLEWGEALNGGAWTDSDAQRSGGFNVFWFSSFYSLEFPFENKTLNCQLSTASKLLPSQAGWRPTASTANSRECQAYRLFPDTAEEYAPDVSLQGRIPRRYALRFVLLSTAHCKSPCARVRRMALSAD